MEKKDRIITFVKAIDVDFFNDFVDGKILMSTIKYFRDLEKTDSNIGDSYEGVKMVCGKGGELFIAEPIEDYCSESDYLNKLNGAEWELLSSDLVNSKFFNLDDDANILSLYAITFADVDNPGGVFTIDQKFFNEFKRHRFIIVMNPNEFYFRIKKALEKMNRTIEMGLVQYYKLDENVLSNLSFFNKPNRLSYQHEFRIVSRDKPTKKMIIDIGPIHDICYELDVSKKHFIQVFDDKFSIKIE